MFAGGRIVRVSFFPLDFVIAMAYFDDVEELKTELTNFPPPAENDANVMEFWAARAAMLEATVSVKNVFGGSNLICCVKRCIMRNAWKKEVLPMTIWRFRGGRSK